MALSSILASIFRWNGISQRLKKLGDQVQYVFLANWYLGLTAFGGPPVHFQIVCEYFPYGLFELEKDSGLTSAKLRRKFVEELQWIDEQTVR